MMPTGASDEVTNRLLFPIPIDTSRTAQGPGGATSIQSAQSPRLGQMPRQHDIPLEIPVFHPSSSTASRDALANVGGATPSIPPHQPLLQQMVATLHKQGPHNAVAALPHKIAKRILDLEFVEMSELTSDNWLDDPLSSDQAGPARRPSPRRRPVTDILLWLECYAKMAAVLTTRFPEKAPEFWAYQATIIQAARDFKESAWVAYDRCYRREALARKSLDWSVIEPNMYQRAFTGQARVVPRCEFCLSTHHTSPMCAFNPDTLVQGFFVSPSIPTAGSLPAQGLGQPTHWTTQPLPKPPPPPSGEICNNFNSRRCTYRRCRHAHVCRECHQPHPVMVCPQNPNGVVTYTRGPKRDRSPLPTYTPTPRRGGYLSLK